MSDRTLHEGDCRDVLEAMPDGVADAVVTDPPYEIGFMGEAWDRTGVAFEPATWSAVLRCLKPGGYMACFGGTKTYHRVACAVEDAGFEIRDCVMWLYGTGMPKGRGCLKPAYEPIVLARRPGPGVLPLGIDGCRVAPTGESRERVGEPSRDRRYTRRGGTDFAAKPGVRGGSPAGRYPANVVHDGGDEVAEAFAAFGERASGGAAEGGHRRSTPEHAGVYRPWQGAENEGDVLYGDAGSAARFFYCAKASRSERGEGNTHPTVKPVELVRWLVRLVCPAGGLVLDPFAGSGTAALACDAEGRRCVMVEADPDHCGIIRRRLTEAEGPLFAKGGRE